MKIVIKKDEHKIVPLLWLGEEKEIEYDIVLAEPGAEVEFWGLLVGKEDEEVSLKVTVTHDAPHTKSQVNVKSALYDSAKTSVDGLAIVNGGAVGSDAWLAAHIMLLSDKATGVAVPSLEIVENDIVAGHATTIGRIDELHMFYLMSRGIDPKTAKQMIVEGFLQDAIDGLPEELAEKARTELARHE